METTIFFRGQVLWSQLDPNRHLRHSAYADFGAQARSNLLNQIGLSLAQFARFEIGPILFREELTYHREVSLDEYIAVTVALKKFNKTNSRFTFVHEIIKDNGVIAATIVVDGAWINLKERKLSSIPDSWQEMMERIPKTEDYTVEGL